MVPRFCHQQNVMRPLASSVLQLFWDLRVVELRPLEVDVAHIGRHTNHVGNTQLTPRASHDISDLEVGRENVVSTLLMLWE